MRRFKKSFGKSAQVSLFKLISYLNLHTIIINLMEDSVQSLSSEEVVLVVDADNNKVGSAKRKDVRS